MLKPFVALVVISGLVAPALAMDSPFYVGGQVSATKLKEMDSSESVSFDFTTISVLAGYQFNPYVAAEVRFGTGVKGERYREPGFQEELTVDQQSMLLLKAGVPLSNSLSLYGLAGYGASKFKYEVQDEGFRFTDSETLDGFAWGVGAGLKFTPRLTATLEYLQLPQERFRDGSDSYKLKANNLSLGLNYQF